VKTLVFGGAFDPPHKGHINLLQNAIRAVRPDEVLVIPSGTSPHKTASQTSGALRAEMCRCFLPCFPALTISTMELEREGKSYTIDTIHQLQAENVDRELYLVVGGDMLQSFTRWHRWDELLAAVTLVVSSREEQEMPRLERAARELKIAGGKICFAKGPVVCVSSSEIRQKLQAGEEVFSLLPAEVLDVIHREGLYTQPV